MSTLTKFVGVYKKRYTVLRAVRRTKFGQKTASGRNGWTSISVGDYRTDEPLAAAARGRVAYTRFPLSNFLGAVSAYDVALSRVCIRSEIKYIGRRKNGSVPSSLDGRRNWNLGYTNSTVNKKFPPLLGESTAQI